MTEGEERARVVAEAMTWLGTPYRGNADVKGAGVDCGMLLVRVFVDTGMIPPFEPRPYPMQWSMHQSAERYLGFVIERSREVTEPLPGDVAMFKFGRGWAHGAIVVDWPVIIHANPPGGCRTMNVVRTASLMNRTPRFFSAWPR